MKQISLGRGPARPGRLRPAEDLKGPLAYTWSQYQPDRQIDFNGHFFQCVPGEAGVLIDPVVFQTGDKDQIESLGGVAAIVLTNSDHVREAALYRDLFSRPVLVPRADLETTVLDGPEPYDPGDFLPCELQAVPVPGNKTPGETALYHAGSATLIVGDAVIGLPAGRLSLLPPEKYADPIQAARGLRALLARPVKHLLLADGHSPVAQPVATLQDLIYELDPQACLLRAAELMWLEPWTKGSRFGDRSAECSRLLGLKTMDFDLTSVPAGRQSVPLHRHDGEEEVFIILSGSGEVLTDRGNFPIAAGDVLGFPPRYQVAHAFRNTGAEELHFLAFAAPSETLEMVDYPDSGKRMELTPYGKRLRFYLPEQTQVPYWEGEQID